MAITSGTGAGIEVTTAAMNESLGSQTNQTGSNTVVASDTLANVNNGNITAPTGYVGRMCIVRQGLGTEETRFITAEAATGTGTEVRLTVNEDWDTVPASSDTIHVSYSSDDMEVFQGMTLSAKTGVYEGGTQREWAIGQGTVFAYAAIIGFQGWEVPDRAATEAGLEIENNGRLDIGYVQGGVGIQGGIITAIQSAATEPAVEVKAGGILRCYSSLFRSWLATAALQVRSTADVVMDGFTIKNMTDDVLMLDGSWTNGSIAGDGTAGEYARLAEETTVNGLILASTAGLHTEDTDVTTETLTLSNVTFIGNIDYITLVNNKTWDMINPVWDATTSTDFEDTAVTGSATVNDRRSVDAVVQEADGTKLQNALVNIYENTISGGNLLLEVTTDVNGEASGTFIYKDHIWTTGTGATQTYGGHALQVGKWLYSPFVAAQTSTEFFDGVVVLSADQNIVQTTQATALTDGSGITWSEPTNPTEIVDFTLGSGTLAVGMILTFTPSGATGTIRESASGDSVAGELYLDVRNATAIANGDTFSRTGGTAGTFSGTYTNDSKQPFTISINGNSKSGQVMYDYLAAKQNETTLSADGELIWEWCRSAQTQPLYATGSSFYTERSNSKGIYIYGRGAGTFDYFTDDAGNTWTAPATVTVQVTVLDDSTGLPIASTARVYIADTATKTEIMAQAVNASGVASISYAYTVDVPIFGWARENDILGTDYVQKDFTGTIQSNGFTTTIRLTPIT